VVAVVAEAAAVLLLLLLLFTLLLLLVILLVVLFTLLLLVMVVVLLLFILSSSICHEVGPLVDPFRSHASRSLFNGLPWFLLPVGEYCFITLGIHIVDIFIVVIDIAIHIPLVSNIVSGGGGGSFVVIHVVIVVVVASDCVGIVIHIVTIFIV